MSTTQDRHNFWLTAVILVAFGVCGDAQTPGIPVDGVNPPASDPSSPIRGCAGGGIVLELVDDTTPSVGQTITLNGCDFYEADVSGLVDGWTASMVHAEAANGTDPRALGYSTRTGRANVDTSVKLVGDSSFHFRSSISKPSCGIGQAGAYINKFLPNSSQTRDFWVTMRARWKRNSANWPSNFIKALGWFPSSHDVQPKNLIPAGREPTEWILDMVGTEARWSLPDGGQLQLERWYTWKIHNRRLERTEFEVWIDGTQVETGRHPPPQRDAPNRTNRIDIGIINGNSTRADCYGWDIESWQDEVKVTTTEKGYTEVWLCDQRTDDPRTNPRAAGCVWQVPVVISNDSIQVVFRKTGAGVRVRSGTRYLFVVSDTGDLSEAFSVTVP